MEIVKDGLLFYLNSKRGVNGDTWDNIAPMQELSGLYGEITGCFVTDDGMYFSVDDYVDMIIPDLYGSSITLEFRLYDINVDEMPDILSSGTIGSLLYLNNYGDRGGLQSVGLFNSWEELGGFDVAGDSFISFVYDAEEWSITTYVNGVQVFYGYANNGLETTEMRLGSTSGYNPSGVIDNIRIYDRALTPEEIEQNFLVGREVGLDDEPPQPITAPQVTIVDVDRYRISNNPPIDRVTIRFKFDTDVTEWTVNVLGVSPSTGVVADSGNYLSAGEETSAIVYSTKLNQEGINRINIYGKNEDGWTLFTN